MIFRNIIDKSGWYCGVYKLIFKEKYVWDYVRNTEDQPMNENFPTLHKGRNGLTIPFSEEDLYED